MMRLGWDGTMQTIQQIVKFCFDQANSCNKFCSESAVSRCIYIPILFAKGKGGILRENKLGNEQLITQGHMLHFSATVV